MKFILSGNNPLSGSIEVSGAKNAALKMISAAILISGKTELENVPKIIDVENMLLILKSIGGEYSWGGNKVTIDTTNVSKHDLTIDISRKLRGSVVYVGSLLAKFGKVTLPFPGGCNIGKRPIDYHIDLFQNLGISVVEENETYIFEKQGEASSEVTLLGRSVTVTENAILYLTLLKGNTTTVRNCAAEPEIDDLINFLNSAGANIKRIDEETIEVTGVDKLNETSHRVMGDRIEAGTWLVLGLLLGDNLKITGFDPKFLEAPLGIAKGMNGNIEVGSGSITVNKSELVSKDITTGVYPEFPTDLQSPFGLLLTQSTGTATLNETVFNDRFKYLHDLVDMGADIKIESKNKAVITGPRKLSGRIIESADLRAGATMVLAGLIADGTTEVDKAEVIDRGYEKIDDKLSRIGAKIQRES